jgi:hypothetical protein
LVLIISFFWVMAANIARVLAVIQYSRPSGLDLSQGLPHEILGVATFLIAFGLTLSTDRLFLVFNPPASDFDEQPSESTWHELHPPKLAALTISVLVIAGGAVSIGLVTRAASTTMPSLSYKFDIAQLSPSFLPDTIGAWRLIRFNGVTQRADDDNMAARSQSWHFTNGQVLAVVSLDYPYPGYHDLQGCYQNIGWELDARYHETVPAAFVPPSGDFVRLKLVRGKQKDENQKVSTAHAGEEFAYVAFSTFTIDGQPELIGAGTGFLDILRTRFDTVLARLGGGQKPRLRQPAYQVQVICQSPLPWTPAQINQLDDFFLRVRQLMLPPRLQITR